MAFDKISARKFMKYALAPVAGAALVYGISYTFHEHYKPIANPPVGVFTNDIDEDGKKDRTIVLNDGSRVGFLKIGNSYKSLDSLRNNEYSKLDKKTSDDLEEVNKDESKLLKKL